MAPLFSFQESITPDNFSEALAFVFEDECDLEGDMAANCADEIDENYAAIIDAEVRSHINNHLPLEDGNYRYERNIELLNFNIVEGFKEAEYGDELVTEQPEIAQTILDTLNHIFVKNRSKYPRIINYFQTEIRNSILGDKKEFSDVIVEFIESSDQTWLTITLTPIATNSDKQES
jgi:hypothetical protein